MSVIDSLHSTLLEREQKNSMSGAILITQADKDIFAASYGYAHRGWHIKNHLDIRFDIASITKMFTTVAILQVIDSGKLSFDSKVVDFLALQDTLISKEVTVYHLLTHTSGIGDDADEEAGESYEAIWRDKPNYSVTETVDFLPQFIHKPANFQPGEGTRYNNVAFVLLGLLIEKITGLSYRDYVRQFVFMRAGMKDSDFLRMDGVHENVAEGYDPITDENGVITGWRKNIYSYPPIGSPDGGAYSTVRDLDRFLKALRRGELLSPAMTEAIQSAQVDYKSYPDTIVKFGYGFLFAHDLQKNLIMYGKEGINVGTSGMMCYFPSLDMNVCILANLEDCAIDLMWEIYAMVVAGQFNKL